MIFEVCLIIFNIIFLVAFIIIFALHVHERADIQLKLDLKRYNGDYILFNEDTHKMVVDKIKRLLVTNKALLEKSDFEIIKNYSFNHPDAPHNTFMNWNTEETNFIKLCNFGVQLLKYYVKYKKPEQYLFIVTDILKRIKIKPDDVALTYPEQWKTWDTGISGLLQLMATYEYVANDDFIKQSVCHNLIIKLVPKLDQLLDRTISNEKLVLSGIPRLLTNFLFDPLAYKNDIINDKFKTLDKYFNIEYNTSDEVKTGLYMDGSCINNNSVASYIDLLPLLKKRDDFYDNMYIALGFKVNYHKRVKSVLEKLLHKSIKFHIVGLFDNFTNKMNNLDWWNVQPLAEGVHIFPFIGVGVFKTPNLMFAIRLQQMSIDSPLKNKLTLGLTQLRKIYTLEDNETAEFSQWNKITNEPGVIHTAEDDHSLALDTEDAYECNPEESYIGRLVDTDLLFWSNKYQLSTPYKCEITEIGVMTKGGLVSKYKIKNKELTRSLTFNNKNNHDNKIAADKTHIFPLEIIINKDEVASEVIFKSDKLLEFEYERKKYEVISLDQRTSFIVKHEGKLILSGKASSNPFDYMFYENKILKRYSSLMYEPQ